MYITKVLQDIHVGSDKLPLMILHFQRQKVSYPLLSLGVHVHVVYICVLTCAYVKLHYHES